VAGSCEYGDEPSGSGATELVSVRRWKNVENPWLTVYCKSIEQLCGDAYPTYHVLHLPFPLMTETNPFSETLCYFQNTRRWTRYSKWAIHVAKHHSQNPSKLMFQNIALMGHLMVKAKAVPLHAMKALGGRGYIAPTRTRPRH
jgi:hypothetical protein